MLPILLFILAAFPPLHPRAPWKPDRNLPRQSVQWIPLLRNPEIRFLTENQLSLTLDKSPGIARLHYYPVRRPVELTGKLDYNVLAKRTQLQDAAARLKFSQPLTEASYQWLPHRVTRLWEGAGSRIREEIAVHGNQAAIRLTRLAGAPLLVTLEAPAQRELESGIIVNSAPHQVTLETSAIFAIGVGYEPQPLTAPEQVFESAYRTWDYYFTALVPRLSTANQVLDRLYYYLFYVVRSSLFDIPYEPYQYPYTCPWKTGAIWQWTWNTGMNAVTERWLNDSSLAKAGTRLIAANNGSLYFGSYLHPFHPAPPWSIFDWYPEVDAAQKKLAGKDYAFLSVMPYSVPNAFLGIREVYLMTGDQSFLDQNLPLMHDYEQRARQLAPPGSILTPFPMMVDEFDYSLRWKPVQKTFTKGGQQRAFDVPVEMVDVNSYLYVLRRILEDAYTRRGDHKDAAKMHELAARTRREVNARFWDQAKNFYCDTRSDTHASTGVRAVSGFAPLYAGIAPPAQRKALLEALDNPKLFGAPYPVPSIELDHPDLDANLLTYGGDSLITTGVWTVVNALAAAGEDVRAADYLARAIRMMTAEGVSSSYSYNALTGHPNQAKHTLATQSAIVNDLIVRYIVGLNPVEGNAIDFHPMAATIAKGRLHYGPFRYKERHWIEVDQVPEGFRLTIDGTARSINTAHRVRITLRNRD
ncbi:MAG: hypothetical protein IT160_08380 [Bryobacterales bacterium]|nr:hypothetical protein [Bryobacterales bacterium]